MIASVGVSFLRPVAGWLAGETIVEYIADYDHWVAFGLLLLVSGGMFRESFSPERSQEKQINIARGVSLILLSVATSTDALVVGLFLALLDISTVVDSPTKGGGSKSRCSYQPATKLGQ